MTIRYELPPMLREKLKQPLGILIRGSFADTMKKFGEIARKENPTRIVTVGDTVSRNLAASGFSPQLSIVDNKCMRRSIQPIRLLTEKTVYVRNPQATITEEAITAIKNALEADISVKIVVDGEEDLLTLVAILYAPENSFILYGQPHEGMVIVKTTCEKKAEIAEILKAMETVRKAK
jgi:uncharacterized protein (UPF0218 family)